MSNMRRRGGKKQAPPPTLPESSEESEPECVVDDCTWGSEDYSSLEAQGDSPFRGYPKIKPLRSNVNVSHFSASRTEWIAQEKIHGCNVFFCVSPHEVSTDDDDDSSTGAYAVRMGRRTGWIAADEKFYGWQSLLESHRARLVSVFQRLMAERSVDSAATTSKEEEEEVYIYGEMFGGRYEHPDVEKLPVSHIQKGVFYCPDVRFQAYDIKIGNDPLGGWVDADHCERLLSSCGIMTAAAVCRGSLEEVLRFNVEQFVTRVPQLLGLPAIDRNYAEGIVIKPVKCLYQQNGAIVRIKKKRSTFLEKRPVHLGQVDPRWRTRKRSPGCVPRDPRLAQLCPEAASYVCTQRLDNVLSKGVGFRLTRNEKCIGRLASLLTADALEDMQEDAVDGGQPMPDPKMARKVMMNESRMLIDSRIDELVADQQ